MKLMNVHKDVKDYLETRCYCPYEIYDETGLFYRMFYPEQECEIVGMCDDMFAVTAKPFKDASNPDEVILFYLKEGDPSKITDAVRYDATENNLEITRLLIEGTTVSELKDRGMLLDEYNPGSMEKNLKQVYDMCDAIAVDM